MCYAIPGKVVSVDGKTATVDYFGERRRAHIMGKPVAPGDYVYAQGGVIIGTLSAEDALPILETWREQFFLLKEVDGKLSSGAWLEVPAEGIGEDAMLSLLATEGGRELETLYAAANRLRRERLDNACCVHGILEFSNACAGDCLYCGIRAGNAGLKRYRMTEAEIMDAVDNAASLGFKALVLQSGEDPHYTDAMLASIVKSIRKKHDMLLFMSVGERGEECYRGMYDAGAYGALLRFETSNPELYSRMRPGKKLEDRLALIRRLKELGFVLATGFLAGLPGQTDADLVNDILLTKSIAPDMHSFGPLIPHPATPLASVPKPTMDHMLKLIAVSRLADPEAKILVTTAMETLAPDARAKGLLAGANSLMINVTPDRFRACYDLYPGKAEAGGSPERAVQDTVDMLRSLGRAPTDLGI